MRRSARDALGLLTCLIFLAGCGPTVSIPHPRIFNRPQLVLGVPRSGLNPFIHHGKAHNWVISLMYDSLLRIRPNGQIAPDIANSWKTKNHYKTFIFHLNPHAKWWNGRPVSVHDVAWTYSLYANPAAPLPSSQSLTGLIRKVQILNTSTVEVQLSHPDPGFLANVVASGNGHPILPAFMVYNVPITQLASSSVFNKIPNMMGSGPYRPVLANHSGIKWMANAHYFLGIPKSHVLITTWNNSPAPDINWTSHATEGQSRVLYYQGPEYYMLLYNNQQISPAISAALPCVINRLALARVEDHPFMPAYQPVVWSSPYHIKLPQSNPDSALANAGYQRRHHVWINPQGHPVQLTITIPNTATATLLANDHHHQLTGRGWTNHVLAVPTLSTVLVHHAFMMALVKRRAMPYPALMHDYGRSLYNYGMYDNPMFRESLANIVSSFHSVPTTKAALKVLLTEPPGIFLLWSQHTVFVNPEVHGFRLNSFDPLQGIQNWTVSSHQGL